jgi:O-antigen ligase
LDSPKGIYFLGNFLSVMGVVSFVWPEVRQSFHLAAPLTWLGLFPYGASHNLLAEALVSIIPFSWLLVYRYQNKNYAKFLYLGLALMIATVVLTFSRTGWLVLFIELLLLSVFYYQVNVRSWLRKYWWIFIWLAMVIIFYWFTLGQTNFVTSSNEARLAMIERSWQLFLDHPLIGNGVGTWQAIISNDVIMFMNLVAMEQHASFGNF